MAFPDWAMIAGAVGAMLLVTLAAYLTTRRRRETPRREDRMPH
jgi:LPXTG-motif cell wall-anchored protein